METHKIIGMNTETKTQMEFQEFAKIARLSRDCVVTEKIDGTNGTIFINDNGEFLVGSRTRWITETDDNYGFAKWVAGNKSELLKLGPGLHRGEWWGQGIQRTYGLKEKRFSLFNVARWTLYGTEPKIIPSADPRIIKKQDVLPECVGLVPILYQGLFETSACNAALEDLRANGSKAAPGFPRAEGIVVWHIAANMGFKKTLDNDALPKSLVK